MASYLWTAQVGDFLDSDQQSKTILLEKRSPHIKDEQRWCSKKHWYFTFEMLQNNLQCAWTQWGFISTNCMTASSLKTKFPLNTNAAFVLTLQCWVLSLPLSAQPPYKLASLWLWPHIPKLPCRKLHAFQQWQKARFDKYAAAMGFKIRTLKAFISRWYPITGFFPGRFKIMCLPLWRHKKNHRRVWNCN